MTGSSAVEASPHNGRTGLEIGGDGLLAVVADPIRWRVLDRLTCGQACACDLQAVTGVAPNLLSYHLKVLREAGLVTASRRGRWIDYRLAEGALARMGQALPGRGAQR